MKVFICLVGSNPLPDYVVCKYLSDASRDDKDELSVPDKYLLVHSEETKDYANGIKNKLTVKEKCKLVSIGNSERNGYEIRKQIKDKLQEIKDNIEEIHLNYTGGTKPMAVNAYIAVREFIDDGGMNDVKFVSSDIDPGKFRLLLNEDNNIYYPKKNDLREEVKLSIKDVFELYNMKLNDKDIISKNDDIIAGTNNADKINNMDKFAQIMINKSVNKKCYDTYGTLKKIENDLEELRKRTRNRDANFSGERIKKYENEWLILRNLKKDLSQKGIEFNSETYGNVNTITPENYSKLISYIAGGLWLEDYMLMCINEIQKDCGIDEVKRSVKAETGKMQKQCEIDVVAIKGYQLFFISCTTASCIKMVKQKAFEVIFRSEQLGGEHSKPIMVNLMSEQEDSKGKDVYSNNRALQNIVDSFNSKSNFNYISKDDLLDKERLLEKLKYIFK